MYFFLLMLYKVFPCKIFWLCAVGFFPHNFYSFRTNLCFFFYQFAIRTHPWQVLCCCFLFFFKYSDSQYCFKLNGLSLSMYIKFVKLAEFDDCYKNVLLRSIFKSGSTCILVYKNKQLGYTADRESIFSTLKLVHFCIWKFEYRSSFFTIGRGAQMQLILMSIMDAQKGTTDGKRTRS